MPEYLSGPGLIAGYQGYPATELPVVKRFKLRLSLLYLELLTRQRLLINNRVLGFQAAASGQKTGQRQ